MCITYRLEDTVNRQSSTSRDAPLKIAIEMADAAAVERLIALGADVEQASDYVPSALCYAMLLLHGSIHRTDPTQEAAYLEGRPGPTSMMPRTALHWTSHWTSHWPRDARGKQLSATLRREIAPFSMP